MTNELQEILKRYGVSDDDYIRWNTKGAHVSIKFLDQLDFAFARYKKQHPVNP